jgi:hypothetical protein
LIRIPFCGKVVSKKSDCVWNSGKPNKNRVKSYVEESTGIFKLAGGAVESLTSFVQKAQKLGPYLGSAAGWLSTFI